MKLDSCQRAKSFLPFPINKEKHSIRKEFNTETDSSYPSRAVLEIQEDLIALHVGFFDFKGRFKSKLEN